ncbi:MAG: hypothetical protein PVH41_07445 [Anaerolineae bacterium]|jgi:hypothetical protein
MNHTGVLKRSWHTLWHYRALWLFGIVLALVTFSWETATVLNMDEELPERGITITTLEGETFLDACRRTARREIAQANRELNQLLNDELGVGFKVHILAVIAALMSIAVIASIVAKIARYVSETALIRMIGVYEETGEKAGIRQGLRWGLSRSAWRLFLINLAVTALATLAVIMLFGLILAPLPLWVNGSEGVVFTFAFLTGGLFLVGLGIVIVAGTGVSVMKRLARQACALEGLGVTAAIGRGWQTIRAHPADAALMWLITIGLKLGWALAMVPVVLVLVGLGVMMGGFPALAAGGLPGLAAAADVPVFVALALGIPIFLLVLVGPLVLLAGLREVLLTSLWTLTYREMRGLEKPSSETLPVGGPAALESAAPA